MANGYKKSKNRLTFDRHIMDSIGDADLYINEIESLGIFKISKQDFYKHFRNVAASKSWVKGSYNYANFPKRAEQFLTRIDRNSTNENVSYCESKAVQNSASGTSRPIQDLVGEEIRSKLHEIGKLWNDSPNKKKILPEIRDYWDSLIKEWSEDETLPLIVRKNADKKGESIIHPSGREIVFADNSFAIWVFCNLLKHKRFSLDEIKQMLKKDEIPFMFIASKKTKYKRGLGNNELLNWKLCHKEPIGFNTRTKIETIDIEMIKNHFLRYASPSNMFALPKEIGDLGEIQEFIDEQN